MNERNSVPSRLKFSMIQGRMSLRAPPERHGFDGHGLLSKDQLKKVGHLRNLYPLWKKWKDAKDVLDKHYLIGYLL